MVGKICAQAPVEAVNGRRENPVTRNSQKLFNYQFLIPLALSPWPYPLALGPIPEVSHADHPPHPARL